MTISITTHSTLCHYAEYVYFIVMQSAVMLNIIILIVVAPFFRQS
jgi:hypothetical protein